MLRLIEAIKDSNPFAVATEIHNLCFPFSYSFIYSVARRNPYMYAPTILSFAADYEHALQSCCQESDVGACLDAKVGHIFHCV